MEFLYPQFLPKNSQNNAKILEFRGFYFVFRYMGYNHLMSEAISVFRRQEKKYLISEAEKQAFLEMCGENLTKNKFFSATVMSLYFDTANDDLIIESIERPRYKKKVRARCYNVPSPTDMVFFEIKSKMREGKEKRTYKRRIEMTAQDFDALEFGKFDNIEQKEKEIFYLVNKLKLMPKTMICCERQSYEGADDANLRVTFDENLRHRHEKLRFFDGIDGKRYFDENNEKNIIMEIKDDKGLPRWLIDALNSEKIYPQQFSKYGKIYQKERRMNV